MTEVSPDTSANPSSLDVARPSEPERVRRSRTVLARLDAASITIVLLFVTVVTEGWAALREPTPFLLGIAGGVLLISSLWWRNAYVMNRSVAWNGNFRLAWDSLAGATLSMVALSWLFQVSGTRLWLLLVVAGWFVSLTLWRFLLRRSPDKDTELVRVIVAGNTGDALATRLALRADPRVRYEVEGFVMDRLDESVPEIVSQMALGSIDHLSHVVQKTDADLVVVCLGALDAERFAPMVRDLNVLGVDVALSTGLSNVALRRVSLGHIAGRPLVHVTPAPLRGWHLGLKRALDIIGATVMLGLAGPLMALGSIDHLSHVVQKTDADLVVVCLGALDAERFAPMVRDLNVLGVDVALSTGLSNVALRRVSLGHIAGRPLVHVTPAPLRGWHLGLKRALDIIGATVMLGLAGPLMALAAIAIRIEDGGRAIFSQTRVGKGGKHFTIFKYRTMVNDAEKLQVDLTNDHEGPVFKMTDDPRITRVGRFLRKTSIDELPQLFNILRGEMSLVGPRPLPVHEVEAAPVSFLDRHMVKPGLTGRWQVSGRSDTGFKELDELDRWYVDNWSLGQDLEILAKTVPAVLMARGAR